MDWVVIIFVLGGDRISSKRQLILMWAESIVVPLQSILRGKAQFPDVCQTKHQVLVMSTSSRFEVTNSPIHMGTFNGEKRNGSSARDFVHTASCTAALNGCHRCDGKAYAYIYFFDQ